MKRRRLPNCRLRAAHGGDLGRFPILPATPSGVGARRGDPGGKSSVPPGIRPAGVFAAWRAAGPALHTSAPPSWDEVLSRWPWYASMRLRWSTLQAFAVQPAGLLARWWVHARGPLAQDLRPSGELPPEWSTAHVPGWIEAASLAAPNGEEAQPLSGALLMLAHSPTNRTAEGLQPLPCISRFTISAPPRIAGRPPPGCTPVPTCHSRGAGW